MSQYIPHIVEYSHLNTEFNSCTNMNKGYYVSKLYGTLANYGPYQCHMSLSRPFTQVPILPLPHIIDFDENFATQVLFPHVLHQHGNYWNPTYPNPCLLPVMNNDYPSHFSNNFINNSTHVVSSVIAPKNPLDRHFPITQEQRPLYSSPLNIPKTKLFTKSSFDVSLSKKSKLFIPPDKKIKHLQSEQKRRSKFKIAISTLRTLLLDGPEMHYPMTYREVIHTAIDSIIRLQEYNYRLKINLNANKNK